MAPKKKGQPSTEAQPSTELADALVRLKALEDGPSVRRAIWNELQSNWKAYSLSGSVVSLLFWFAVLSPIKDTRSDLHDLTKPDGLIDRQTKMLSDQNSKLEGLSTKLSTLEPFVRSLALKKLDDASISPPSIFKESLPQLADTSSAARISGLLLNPPTVDKLRAQLSQSRAETDASYWALTANVLSMRSVPLPSDRACLGVDGPTKLRVPDNIVIHEFNDCTLILDDVANFTNGNGYRHAQQTSGKRTPDITLELNKVRVLYSGGPILPVNTIIFTNCVFIFALTQQPREPNGASLVQSLIAAKDLKSVDIYLNNASSS